LTQRQCVANGQTDRHSDRTYYGATENAGVETCTRLQEWRTRVWTVGCGPGLEKNLVFGKRFSVFKFLKPFWFLGFIVRRRPHTKLRSRKNIPYTILADTSFSINYNKTHRSRLKYEIMYDLYKIGPKN